MKHKFPMKTTVAIEDDQSTKCCKKDDTLYSVCVWAAVILLASPFVLIPLLGHRFGVNNMKCPNTKNVPCFCNGQEIDVEVAMCVERHEDESLTCRPCEKDFFQDDTCARFKNCESCLPGLNKCLKCPEGKRGMFCENDALVSFDIGQPRKKKRASRATACKIPDKSENSDIHCSVSHSRVSCTETCVWGYKFAYRGGKEKKLSCEKDRDRWDQDFGGCESYVNCELQFVYPGKMSCLRNVVGEPVHCNVSCERYDTHAGITEKKYVCREDGSFQPALPFCVKKK